MRDEYTFSDILYMFDTSQIVDTLDRDPYYSDILIEVIKDSVKGMDKEDQCFFNDLHNPAILLKAYREEVGDCDLISLMKDAGYSNDIVCLMCEEINEDD